MNASVLLGDRNQGLIGVLLCLHGADGDAAGDRGRARASSTSASRSVPEVNAALIGAAAASAGLVLGTALKMVRNIRPTPAGARHRRCGTLWRSALLRWPLVPVVVVLVPLGHRRRTLLGAP